MLHKVHMGSSLPSVIAGKPYQIVGFNQSVSDWSTVVYPADVRRCESDAISRTSALREAVNLPHQTRAREPAGPVIDDVNFATGVNHAGGPPV